MLLWRLLRSPQQHVSSSFSMTPPPTRVTTLVNLNTLFGLCSGPFALTCGMYAPCFMFLMVTGFILLGWMSRLVWVSPSQMPIRHLWLLITCQPLGLRSSGSHTWLHSDYILPPDRFVWLFMDRAALLPSTKSTATDLKMVSQCSKPKPRFYDFKHNIWREVCACHWTVKYKDINMWVKWLRALQRRNAASA